MITKKLKADQNFFGWAFFKNRCDQFGHATLKLNRLNKVIFFHAGMDSGKFKVDSMIFGWVWLKMAMAF